MGLFNTESIFLELHTLENRYKVSKCYLKVHTNMFSLLLLGGFAKRNMNISHCSHCFNDPDEICM